jgi:hypothetical protein
MFSSADMLDHAGGERMYEVAEILPDGGKACRLLNPADARLQ